MSEDVFDDMNDTLGEILEQLRDIYHDMPLAEDLEGRAGGGNGQPEADPYAIDPSKGGKPAEKAKKGGKSAASYAWDMLPKSVQSVSAGFLSIGKALGPAGVIAGVAAGLAGFGAAVYASAEGLISMNRNLARFNGQLAVAYANSTLREFARNQGSADRRSESLSKLIDAVDDFKDSVQPILDAGFNVVAGFLSAIMKAMTWLSEQIKPVLKQIVEYLGGIWEETKEKKSPHLLPAAEFLMGRLQGRQQLDTKFSYAG